MSSKVWEELYIEPDPRPALGSAEVPRARPNVWDELLSEPGPDPAPRPAELPWARPPDGPRLRLARLRAWAAETGESFLVWRWRELVRRRARIDFKRRCWSHLGAYLREVKEFGVTARRLPRG